MTAESLPILAETVQSIHDGVRALLSEVAASVHPGWEKIEVRYQERLEALGHDSARRKALAAITPGAAARSFGRGNPPAEFIEQVAYHGRRLAKLNLTQSDVLTALAEYDRILTPVLRRRLAHQGDTYRAAREQLHFTTLLTVNNAYFHVREEETKAFYELFWAELESRNLDDLLYGFLKALSGFCRADQAQVYLIDDRDTLTQRACWGAKPNGSCQRSTRRFAVPFTTVEGKVKRGAIDPRWDGHFATIWSVPMLRGKKLTGVIQFAFSRPYEWLPREQAMLASAAERCMMAIEKQQLMEHLDLQQHQIRSLAAGMLHVEEAERRRISRELHDQTGQDLLWIRLQMEMIEQELPEGERRWRSRVADVRDMTEKTIVEVRRLIAALSPAVLEQLGLAAAIRQLVNRFRQSHDSKVRLQIGKLANLPKQLEVIAYRLVQECLNNAARHSSCSNLNISLGSADGLLRLLVEDDGVGFRVEGALAKPGSFGLAGIRERVALLGGRCIIESRQAGVPEPTGKKARAVAARETSGTKIYVELPISKNGKDTKTPTADNHLASAIAETSMFSTAR